MSQLFVPNAIIFCTNSAETHIFRNFWERDACYNIIKSAMREANAATVDCNQWGADAANVVRRDRHRRGSLTPPPVRSARDGNIVAGARSAPTSPSAARDPMQKTASKLLDDDDSLPRAGEPARKLRINDLGLSNRLLAVVNDVDDDDDDEDGPTSALLWEETDKEDAKANHAVFQEAVENEGPQQSVVCDVELPVSPRDFFKTFVGDDSPYSLADFHLARGDWEVDPTSWQLDPEERSAGCKVFRRVIRFKTPLNIQFMNVPNQVRTSKQQRIRVLRGAGFIYDTVTTVEDRIPVSDCFEVEDRWTVRPAGDSNQRCIVNVKFRVVWKKWSVVKGLVEAKVKSDVTSFNNAFVDGIREYLKGRSVGRIQRMASTRAMSEAVSLTEAITSVAEGALPKSLLGSRAQWFLAFVGPIMVVLSLLTMVYFVTFWVLWQLRASDSGAPFALLPSSQQLCGSYKKLGLEVLYAKWGESNLLLRRLQSELPTAEKDVARILESTLVTLDKLAVALQDTLSSEMESG
jgi:hypothetical protein